MRRILDRLVFHANTGPTRLAIISKTENLTYRALLDNVRRIAAWADTLPQTVALLAPHDERWIIWYLALIWAGRTVVPLPSFFSPEQLEHIVQDSRADIIVCSVELLEMAERLGIAVTTPVHAGVPMVTPREQAQLIIYTSGTSGHPKGVLLTSSQVTASVEAMSEVVAASSEDRTLSVLPPELLLQQIAGILVPLSVGAVIILCPQPNAFPMMAEQNYPTATVLVPELLAGWVAWLERSGHTAPPSLRFVAVGGAPVPVKLAEKAWALGLPVYEGYGLSECCSVVAVNRHGERRPGTVGKPLPGVAVSIEEGEIVVSGPTVMQGYLGSFPAPKRHRTGDAGHFDADGNLIVEGRIDDIIVTSTGRNIHPEWLEPMLLSDSRISRCAVVNGGTHPHAVLVPAGEWLLQAEQGEVDALVDQLCADAPAYARPGKSTVLAESLLKQHALITANGRLRRRAIASFIAETPCP